jgi:hypothetical protein
VLPGKLDQLPIRLQDLPVLKTAKEVSLLSGAILLQGRLNLR